MEHRHLTHNELTLAAIDDIIERGTRSAWAELGVAVENDPAVRRRILSIADTRIEADPSNQRFAFWKYYVEYIEQ